MAEDVREAATKANLSAIRCAISDCHGDRERVFPGETSFDKESVFSRHLKLMPAACATYAGWRYVCRSGPIYVNGSAKDSRGKPAPPAEVRPGRLVVQYRPYGKNQGT